MYEYTNYPVFVLCHTIGLFYQMHALSGSAGSLMYEYTNYPVLMSCNNKAPKVQMPRCSSMYASMQLADAYDSMYECSRSMETSKQYHGSMECKLQ